MINPGQRPGIVGGKKISLEGYTPAKMAAVAAALKAHYFLRKQAERAAYHSPPLVRLSARQQQRCLSLEG